MMKGYEVPKEIGDPYTISEQTVRRWTKNHRNDPENGLKPKKAGPKRSRQAIAACRDQWIIRLKEKIPAWGARWIVIQNGLYRRPEDLMNRASNMVGVDKKKEGNKET